MDMGRLGRFITEQHALGKRGALVRRLGLVAHERDGAGVAGNAQCLGGAAARLPGANDEDAFGCGHRRL